MPTDQETSRISARLTALPERLVAASLALASILGDRSPDEVGDVCQALRISNRLADAATWLVRSLPVARREAALELADLKVLMAEACWPELLELLRIDLAVRGGEPEPFTRLHNRASAILGIQRCSRPGRRVYVRHSELPKVLNGMGVSIISTSRGLLTNRQAEEQRLGGEVLCEVW